MHATNSWSRFLVRLVTTAMVLGLTVAVAATAKEVPLKSSGSNDLSDIWWTPTEPGWGMQMVHTGNFIFVTVFAYGPDGKPTWFGGGLEANFLGTYSGKLYTSTGPYYGGTFDPSTVKISEAGTMSYMENGPDDGIFTYTIDGVSVSKHVERQPLKLDNYSGLYSVSFSGTKTDIYDPTSYTTLGDTASVSIDQHGQSMSVLWIDRDDNRCTHTGTYAQVGRIGGFDGTFTCTDGTSGTSNFWSMTTGMGLGVFSARVYMKTWNTQTSMRVTGILP